MERSAMRRWNKKRPRSEKTRFGSQAARAGWSKPASPKLRNTLVLKIIRADRTMARNRLPPGPRREKWMESGAASSTVTRQVKGKAQR